MRERLFIEKAKENTNLEEFIRSRLSNAKCGKIEVQRTPLMTRIVVYTTTVGLVIGTGGEKIREMIEELKNKFEIENPQIDVQKIQNPDLDPHIVAQNIAYSIESGVNYKRLGNFSVQRIMNAGATGVEIVITGKVSGERSRKERFVAGYLKKCGNPAKTDVLKGFATATPRLGSVGVTVKIMPEHKLDIPIIKSREEEQEEEIKKAEEEAEREKIEKQKEEAKKEKESAEEKKEEIPKEGEEKSTEEKKEEVKTEKPTETKEKVEVKDESSETKK